MKKILIGLSLLLLITGCTSTMNTPTKKVEEFLGKYQSMDSEVLAQLDQVISDDINMSDDQKSEYRSLLEKQYQNLSYKIKNEEIDGNKATVDVEIEVYDYAAPNVANATAYRCDENGNANEAGTHVRITLTANISAVGGRNSATLQYRYRLAGGSFGSWIDFTSGAILSGFDVKNSYEFELRAVDALGMDKVASAIVPTESVWLNGRDGGKGAAFGKYAEEDDLLDVAWRTRLRGEVRMDKPYFTADNGETEWIFPPMEVDTEYRTSKRFLGKPVYRKLITLSNAEISGAQTVSVPHGISNLDQILSVKGFTSGYLLPYGSSAGVLNINSFTDEHLNFVNTGTSWSAERTWYFDIEYIKL